MIGPVTLDQHTSAGQEGAREEGGIRARSRAETGVKAEQRDRTRTADPDRGHDRAVEVDVIQLRQIDRTDEEGRTDK